MPRSNCSRPASWIVSAYHRGRSTKIAHAGNSFIRRWQRQYLLKRLEEQAEEASVHAALDNLEQVCKSVSLI